MLVPLMKFQFFHFDVASEGGKCAEEIASDVIADRKSSESIVKSEETFASKFWKSLAKAFDGRGR